VLIRGELFLFGKPSLASPPCHRFSLSLPIEFVENIKAAENATFIGLERSDPFMLESGREYKAVFRLTLIGFLAGAGGCCSCLNPVEPPPELAIQSCRELPKYCRDHVYVFFMNGIDPVNYGNLTGIREYVDTLGFHKTYYGQVYHVGYFADEIDRIHKEEPDAHFVLVGSGCGARKIRCLADRVNADGVSVDLMVHLDGKLPDGMGLENGPMMGTIRDSSSTAAGANAGPWLFGNPTYHQTVEMLGEQLMHIACTIPAVEPATPEQLPPPLDEPTPKPVKRQLPSHYGEWDFLKPARDRVHLQHEDQRTPGGFSG
jgi:hypothetical protein